MAPKDPAQTKSFEQLRRKPEALLAHRPAHGPDAGPEVLELIQEIQIHQAELAPPTLRIVVADDHDVMREGLAGLLDEQKGFHVVGQAPDGREAAKGRRARETAS